MKNIILAVMSTNRNGMTESGGTTEIAGNPEQREGMSTIARNASN